MLRLALPGSYSFCLTQDETDVEREPQTASCSSVWYLKERDLRNHPRALSCDGSTDSLRRMGDLGNRRNTCLDPELAW